MSFFNRNNSKNLFGVQAQASSSMLIKGDKNMNSSTTPINAGSIFDGRRTWEPSKWEKRIDLTREQIETMTPDAAFMGLFENGMVRITGDSNATRKDGIPVIYMNKVQADQLGRALALYANVNYASGYIQTTPGNRIIALYDIDGEHDIVVSETRSEESGHIDYACFYGSKEYNAHAQSNGLRMGSQHKIQEHLKGAVDDGWTDPSGKFHMGYNQWVDLHNRAVQAYAAGNRTPEVVELVKDCKPGNNENHFVQINTVRHIKYESVVNKYVLLAWMLAPALNATGKSFEIHSFAKSADAMQQFLDGRSSKMVWGYRSELRTLSGIAYEVTGE